VLSGKSLEPAPREVLLELMARVGVASVEVVGVGRTATDQASVMYDLCRTQGVEATRDRYSSHAERIIDIFDANLKKPRATVVELMATEIERVLLELGPDRTTMRLVYSDRYVFDVALGDDELRFRFVEAARAHPDVLRVIPPEATTPTVVHVQISRETLSFTGQWVGTCREQAKPDVELRAKLDLFSARSFSLRFSRGALHQTSRQATIDKRRRLIAFQIGGQNFTGVLSVEGHRMQLSAQADVLCLLER
jgi:hypothetical protein